MKKPTDRELDLLANLLREARNGSAPWFAELLTTQGFLLPSALRGTELAALAGVSPGAVSRWVSRDGCPRNGDGTFNLTAVWAWLGSKARERFKTTGDPSHPPTDPLKRKHWAVAELKLQELYAARRELIPRDTYCEMLRARLLAVTAALDPLPEYLAPQCAGKSALEIRDTLRQASNRIRDAFAGESGPAIT